MQFGRDFLVFSTKRSSHHAFIEGLISGLSYIYRNSCFFRNEEFTATKTVFSENGLGFYDVRVSSFEMRYRLPDILRRHFFPSSGIDLATVKKIVFLRDPINTAASTYSVYKQAKNNPTLSRLRYVTDNLSTFAQVSRYLTSGQYRDDGFVFIYANRFWEDSQYQSRIVGDLNLSAAQYSTQMSYFGGGGNSFFGDKKRVLPSDLKNRFKVYQDDSEFIDLIRSEPFNSESKNFLRFVDDLDALKIMEMIN